MSYPLLGSCASTGEPKTASSAFLFLNVSVGTAPNTRKHGGGAHPFLSASDTKVWQTLGGINVGGKTVKIPSSNVEAGASLSTHGN